MFYKLFPQPRTVFYIAALAWLAVLLAPHSLRAANDDAFTVAGVQIDITAENALAAREKAFDEAQTEAFTQLAERMLPEDQFLAFTPPAPDVISTMIKDFELTNERLSKVRYIGTYTFRFRGDAVKHYLGSQGVSYSDVRSKPVLILPYFQSGPQTVLWSDNPWLAAWNSSKAVRGLVPVTVPIGDLQDVSDMNDNDALTFDAEKLKAMTERYGAGEAIILLAIPEWDGGVAEARSPDRLVIMIYRTDRGSAEYANKVVITQQDAANEESLYASAVKRSRQLLQKAWKNQTAVKAEQTNRLKARVRFTSMQEWIETQQKLRRVQGVSDTKLLSLKQNEANVELIFQGTEDRLRIALAQADMTLDSPGAYHGGAPMYDLYMNKYRMP